MITIYDARAEDFSTLGLGTLEPEKCEIEERAGGLYEMLIRQPITNDMRAFLLQNDRIIKADAPMRETPQISIDAQGGQTVQREIYRVNTGGDRLHLRAKPNGKILGAYPNGTKVVKYGESSVSGWWGVIVCEGGAKGYMYSEYLAYDSTQTDVIQGDTPGVVVEPKQTREQLFRIYSVVQDSAGRFIEARARHISYDLGGACIGLYKFKDTPANAVCARLMELADHDAGVNIICGVTDVLTGDFSGKNLLECLLDPETGIAAQTGAKVIRDNFDIYLVPDEERDRGVEIRYGKNLLSAQMETDASDVVTRIIPVGTDAEGNDLYGAPVDSARIGEYPVVRTAVVQYDVEVNEETTQERALAKLQEMARADLDAGCDLMTVRLDAEFVRLELAQEYAELANAYALHLYDSVPVIDPGAGIDVKVRMAGYTYDALLKRYTATELGDISAVGTTIYGYELAEGSIGGTKIANGTITGGKLRDLSIGYAKINTAAIEQLSVDALTAVRADIHKLAAGEITTDELYADLAQIGKAEITYADIEDLDVEVARITKAGISTAEIDGANIKSATIDTAKIALGAITQALIEQGAVGTAQIADGSITEAKIVSLNADVITAGTLSVERLLLKGENGLFREINATDSGLTVEELSQEQYQNAISGTVLVARSITADKIAAKSITSNEILAGTITAAEINVANLFAAEATITAIENVILRTETIEALKGELTLWADERIALKVPGEVDSALKDYSPTGVVDGSQLIINKDEVHIDTPEFSVNVSGADGDMTLDENGLAVGVVNSPSVMARYTGPTELTITSIFYKINGYDTFLSLSDVFALLSDKFIPEDITITLVSDITEDVIELKNTYGAAITVDGGSYTIYGRMQISGVNNALRFQDATLTANDGYIVKLQRCASVQFVSVYFIGGGIAFGHFGAVLIESRASFEDCYYYNLYTPVACSRLSAANLASCGGSNNQYYCYATNGSTMALSGQRPDSTTGKFLSLASWVLDETTEIVTPTQPSVTPTTATTVELKLLNTCTYEEGYGWHTESPLLAQGIGNGKTYSGAMWFDRSPISGKTIKAAKIKLYRRAGAGSTDRIKIRIGVATNSTPPSGGLNWYERSGIAIATCGQEEQITASLPVDMVQHLTGTQVKCIYIWSETAEDYGAFYGFEEAHPPRLSVAYT